MHIILVAAVQATTVMISSTESRNNKWYVISAILILWALCTIQEEFSEEGELDEDLSAALATLRLQQEGRAQDGPKRTSGEKAVSGSGASEGLKTDGTIITQVREDTH